MAKLVRGSAGRKKRHGEQLQQYGDELAPMLLKQIRPQPGGRIMHLGSPGCIALAEGLAPQLEASELVVVVYTYDEMEETRAALAGLGNVEVINEIDEIDPDEPPYDLITCIVPYHLRREYVDELLGTGLRLLATNGAMLVAGDRQQGFERYIATLRAEGSEITPVAQSGQLRIVSAARPGPGGGLRKHSFAGS